MFLYVIITLATVCYNRGHSNNNEQLVIINIILYNTLHAVIATLQLVLLYCGHYILSVHYNE